MSIEDSFENYRPRNNNRLNEPYTVDLERYPTLKKAEKEKLYKDIIEGDEKTKKEAIDKLIMHHLRFIAYITRRRLSGVPDVDLNDLVQDCNLAVVEAMAKFEPTIAEASTFLATCINNSVNRIIKSRKTLKRTAPAGQISTYDFDVDDKKTKTPEDLAIEKERKILIKKKLADALKYLTERPKLVIRMRFGLDIGSEPCTLEQISEILKITRERVRQIEAEAFLRMKKRVPELENLLENLIED